MKPDIGASVQCSAIEHLSSIGQKKSFSRKQILIREGTVGHSLFVLLKGCIRIYTEDIEGNRYVIGHYADGTIFGEGALDGGMRSATVETLSDCICVEICYDQLCQEMNNKPEFGYYLIIELIKRSRESTRKLKGLALASVYQRFRDLMETEGIEMDGGGKILTNGISQQEIAYQIGSSRDMLTRILRDLSKGGYLQVKRGEIRSLKQLPLAW